MWLINLSQVVPREREDVYDNLNSEKNPNKYVDDQDFLVQYKRRSVFRWNEDERSLKL